MLRNPECVNQAKLEGKDAHKAVEHSRGTATVETAACDSLAISLYGNTVVLTDAKGNTATDLKAKNGVVHVIDSVLMP